MDFEYNSTYNIAILREADYFIEEKSYDNHFVFEIIIPKEAIPGEEYELYFRAKPIVDIQGQVPINVEIKRNVKILVVDQDGIGYKKTIFRAIGIFFKNLSRNGFWKIVWPIVLIIAFILAIVFLVKRFWGISSNISSKLLMSKKQQEDLQTRKNYTISEARSVQEITMIIERMSEQQFAVPEIKNLLSTQLKKLKENFLSQKIKSVKSKEEMLRILK